MAPLIGRPPGVIIAGSLLATAGVILFVANVSLTIHRHGPDGIGGVLVNALETGDASTTASASDPDVEVPPDR